MEPEPLDRGLPVQRDRPVARRRARDARRRPAPRLPGRLARRRRRGQRPARPAAGARRRGVADRQPAGRRRGAGVVPRQPVRPGQPLLLRPDQPGARARADLPPAGRAARVHPGAGAAGRAGRRARRGDPHRLPARHPARPVRAGRARRDGRGPVERGGAAALADEDEPRGRAAGVDAAPGARADPDPDHLRRRPGAVARRPPRLQRPGGRRVRPDRARRLRPAVRRGQGADRGRPTGEHGAGAGPVRPARLLAAVDRRLRRRVPDRRGGR